MSLSIFHSDGPDDMVMWCVDATTCEAIVSLMHQVPLVDNPVIMQAVTNAYRHCENCTTHPKCKNKLS